MKLKPIFSIGLKTVKWCLFPLFLLFIIVLQAKPPQLTPKDTRIKIDEILKSHVSYQTLQPELIKRALHNYLDELDPGKTYLTQPEVVKWTQPSDELLNIILNNYQYENFDAFMEIHEVMMRAIARRNHLEKYLNQDSLPQEVKASEFKDISWTQNEEELLDRLKRIRSLQIETAGKLDQDMSQLFFQKITKRRLKREEELAALSLQERKQVILSLVLKATSAALDSQTAYFTPSEANQFLIQVQQRLFGIGAQLRDDLNGFTVVRLLEGGPAIEEHKLKTGDRIIAVNSEPVVGMEITEAVELVRGGKGTKVALTILREIGEGESKREEKLDIELIRGEVVLKEGRLSTHYEPYGDGVIAILHLLSFYQDPKYSSTSDLLEAINTLKKEHNIKGIILDLRNNAGGLLQQAISVTGLFIKKGIVASVKKHTGKVDHLRNIEESPAWDGPLLVLTNLTSASAAEIVSQTLQDYGRTLVVGVPHTWGKGTLQTFSLEASHYAKVNPKGEFKVTQGRFYTVSGKSPQLKGVQADIVVPGPYSQMEIGEKFAKFPLDNDQISANFEDDLSDIPFMHRAQIKSLYQFDLQPIMTTYKPFLKGLQKNSQERIALNKNYQVFLKELNQTDLSLESSENFGKNDLQLEETLNIMKDLVLLMAQNSPNP